MAFFRVLLFVVSLAGIGYVGYIFISNYLQASGSRWSRILFAFDTSLTILWSRVVLVSGLLINVLVESADYMNLPGVSSAIQTYVTPTTLSLVVAGIAIVTELARRRTL